MAKRPVVLVTLPKIPQPGIDILKLTCDIIYCDTSNNYASIYDKCRGVQAILWAGREKLGADVIKAAGEQLKVITSLSTDHSHIDTNLLSQRGILFASTPAVVIETVANMAICLLLAAARRFHEARLKINNGEWAPGRHKWMLGFDIRGNTCGFYGYCDITKTIIDRLKFFGITKFIYTNPNMKTEEITDPNAIALEVNFNQLLVKSDFIIITTYLTRATEKKFDKDAFNKMKPTAILVNVSRGKIIDQIAMYEALKNNKIFAAGIDQLENEPCLSEEPLLRLPNCVITPHLASATKRTREDMAIVAAHNIIRGLAGEPLFS